MGSRVVVEDQFPQVTRPVLIGLMGAKGAGKDTAASMLAKDFIVYGPGHIERVAFADKLKAFAYDLDPFVEVMDQQGMFSSLQTVVNNFGWDEAKQWPDVRRLLQRLGTEATRHNLGQDVWVRAVADDIARFLRDGSAVIVTDVRFENEIEFIRAHRGELWRIDRPEVETGDQHISEVEWRECVPDVTILNDGPLHTLATRVQQEYRNLAGRLG